MAVNLGPARAYSAAMRATRNAASAAPAAVLPVAALRRPGEGRNFRRIGRDVLDSPALGTSGSDLIRRCAQQEPHAAEPPPVAQGPPLAVALSGGGFRAALAGIGMLWCLADAAPAWRDL